jgi:XTP/dITP diphosphohydrolase
VSPSHPEAPDTRAPEAPDTGDALRDAVAVMDLLRSPGGCPWDAEQTHESLARYLVEETYEVLDAIETDDPALLREELGDVLLQVLFHARLAEERTDGQAFDIDDVAGDLAAKLVRRHPHVFAPEPPAPDGAQVGADEVNTRWEALKAQEKARASVTDGVPMGLPALALASKLVSRAQRGGLSPVLDAVQQAEAAAPDAQQVAGAALLAAVRAAVDAGVDPESALRATARRMHAELIRAESSAG